jgi:hypothetical protein
MMKTVLCKYTLFAKVMTRLSQDPLASSISGTRRSIDTALEEIMAEFSMVFQLELHRQILQKKKFDISTNDDNFAFNIFEPKNLTY